MAPTEAQKRAIEKYNREKIDRITIRVKKGVRERIIATGAPSINGFITEAIEEKLNRETGE